MSATLVYTGDDRQLHLVSTAGGAPRQLTLDLSANPLMMWGQPELQRSSWSWPCWRPDGRQVAAFELPDGDDPSGPARVHLLDVDGVRQVNLLDISGRVPIYCAWQPDGQGLALLMQDDEQLMLGFAHPERPGVLRAIEEGSPLFFAWAPDGRRLLVHASSPGSPPHPRVVLRDPLGEWPDEALPGTPGGYCAPVVIGDRVAHVERSRGVNRLIVSNADGEEPQALLEFQGLGAIVPADSGRLIFSAAPGGQGTPYRGATLLDPGGAAPVRVTEDDCLAFFWSPRGELIYAQVNTRRNCLTWHRARPGEPPVELAAFWPTREQLFALHFFDQFAISHLPLSPDGRYLVFAGNVQEGPRGRDKGRILLLDLDHPGPPRDIDGGTFACFSPVAPPVAEV